MNAHGLLAWTPTRRKALEVFFCCDGVALRSNVTNVGQRRAPYTAVDWMHDHGLIEPHVPITNGTRRAGVYRLTAEGWRAGASLWSIPFESLQRLMAKQPPVGATL